MRKWTVILAAVLMAASCTTKVRLEDARDHFARFTCTLDNSAVTMADTELMPKWFTMACTRIMKEEHYFWEDVYYTAPNFSLISALISFSSPSSWCRKLPSALPSKPRRTSPPTGWWAALPAFRSG